MSEEDERGRRAFYGQRLGSVKVHRTGERHPRRGQRFFHEHGNGSFSNQTQEEKDMNEQERAEKLKRMEAEAAAFKAAHPEEAKKLEAETAAWMENQAAKAFPFESAVQKLRATGMNLSTAICKAAEADPEGHADYLQRAQAGQARPLA